MPSFLPLPFPQSEISNLKFEISVVFAITPRARLSFSRALQATKFSISLFKISDASTATATDKLKISQKAK